MKFPALFFTGVFLSAIFSFSAGAAATNGGAFFSADFTQNQIIESWGWIFAQEKELAGDEISDAELSIFQKGFSDGAHGKSAPFDLGKIYPDVERLAKARHEKVVLSIRRKNQAEAEKFFAELRKRTNVFVLPENVYYEISKSGGAHPKLQQTVNVHYTARLMDGTEFSQMGPMDMVLVTNRDVCRGWSEAIEKMGVGGSAKLYVPPPLSEDDALRFGVQPDAAMIFEIELLGIKNTSPEDLENATMPSAPEPLPPPPSGFATNQIIETWGWVVAKEMHAEKFGFSDAEISLLEKGLVAGIQNQPCPFDVEKIYPAVEKFVQDQREKVRQTENQKRLDEMNALFLDLKKNTNVVELPDGLRYEILKPGGGAFPKSNQTVTVLYTGKLIDGKIFDSTEIGPLNIDLDKVIGGWSEGVEKIGKGGKIKLYIPPALGYRDVATSGIPPNSLLIYQIELLEIKDGEPNDSPSNSVK